jgi:hypothetical protein
VVLEQQSPEEKAGYTEPADLRGQGRQALEKFFIDHLSAMAVTRARLLEGVLNEVSRLQRVHPFDEKDLCLYLGLKAMIQVNAYYRYLLVPLQNEAKPPSAEVFSKELDGMVASIEPFLRTLEAAQGDDNWVVTRDFVAPLVRRWRELFVVFMDIPTPAPSVGINITQPPSSGVAGTKRQELLAKRKSSK